MLVEIADVIDGEIFRSGYNITEVIVIIVHRPTMGTIRVAGLVMVVVVAAGTDEQ